MTTKVIQCKCKNAFQDERYGLRMRIHNMRKLDGSMSAKWRCTVCGDEKSGAIPIGKSAQVSKEK